jgi:hypothetical protein
MKKFLLCLILLSLFELSAQNYASDAYFGKDFWDSCIKEYGYAENSFLLRYDNTFDCDDFAWLLATYLKDKQTWGYIVSFPDHVGVVSNYDFGNKKLVEDSAFEYLYQDYTINDCEFTFTLEEWNELFCQDE